MIGETIQHYRILAKLGEGGMAGWVIPASGGEARKVLDGHPVSGLEVDGDWSPDGKQVVYTKDTDKADMFTLEGVFETDNLR